MQQATSSLKSAKTRSQHANTMACITNAVASASVPLHVFYYTLSEYCVRRHLPPADRKRLDRQLPRVPHSNSFIWKTQWAFSQTNCFYWLLRSLGFNWHLKSVSNFTCIFIITGVLLQRRLAITLSLYSPSSSNFFMFILLYSYSICHLPFYITLVFVNCCRSNS